MHVCVLQTVLDPFKGGNHLPLLAQVAGVQFTIVCNRSKVTEAELPSNVSVVTVPGRIGPYYYGCSDLLFARLVLSTYPPQSDFWQQFQVIHLNQVMGPALKQLTSTGIAVALLIHHPVTADLEVALAETSGLDALMWRLKYMFLVRWQRQLSQRVSRVITVSETMRQRIADDYQVDPQQISVVSNGVNTDLFTPVPDSDCRFDVVAVGSFIHPRKGFGYLLRVYQELASQGVTIADVGRRSEQQTAALQQIDGVTVHGTVDADTLVDLVRHSRTLVSTSLFEGFGLSLIEALACGHPAFAFAVGAVPEVLGNIDKTLIVEPRAVSSLVDRVTEYLNLSAHERDRKGAVYREAVLQHYSISASTEALRSVYSSLI